MGEERYETGLRIRREVLGAEYVDRSISMADDFNRPLQELVTEYCWEKSGPGRTEPQDAELDYLAMLTALNRPMK